MDAYKIECHYCHGMYFFGELTKDHVVPASVGGRNIVENIVPACSACNNAKADTMPTCDCEFCLRAVVWFENQWEGLPIVKRYSTGWIK